MPAVDVLPTIEYNHDASGDAPIVDLLAVPMVSIEVVAVGLLPGPPIVSKDVPETATPTVNTLRKPAIKREDPVSRLAALPEPLVIFHTRQEEEVAFSRGYESNRGFLTDTGILGRAKVPTSDPEPDPEPAPESELAFKPPLEASPPAPASEIEDETRNTTKPTQTASIITHSAPAPPLDPPLRSEMVPKSLAALVNDQVAVALEGYGWIFTGMEPNTGGMRFAGRKHDAVQTIFTFGAYSAGEYTLSFQQQNNTTGTLKAGSAIVLVREVDTIGTAVVSAEARAPIVDTAADEHLVGEERVAALLTSNPAEVLKYLDEYLEGLLPADADEILPLILIFENRDLPEETARCMEAYVALVPDDFGNDRRYFELGRMYELPALRDEKKAHGYYSQVVDYYPASFYYEDALERKRYLERHFLRLR